MNEVQGNKLSGLATAPRFSMSYFGGRGDRYAYWRNNPDKLERRRASVIYTQRIRDSELVAAAGVEGRIDKMAESMKDDRKKIDKWLERYEAYREEYG